MARKIRPVLQEIITAIEGINAAIAGKTLADYQNEWLLRHGIQRGIEIISEATRHLPPALLARHTEIPWDRIKGIGSVLRHEYHRISDKVVWTVAVERLPLLNAAIEAMEASLTD